jgi:hypothetical protein
MRLLNILVIGALVLAASLVYKIKFDSTLQAARVAKMRAELRHEREAIAMLRAEWARLDTPGRIQGLAERHLTLQPEKASQFSTFNDLPPRPPDAPPGQDAIGALVARQAAGATGSVPAPGVKR